MLLISRIRHKTNFISNIFSLTILISSFCIQNSSAFQCYVCDSKNDIECVENLTTNSRLIPQDCQNITGAKFCIKTTNIYAGELGTKRFCAANDHGNYCKYIRQPTGDRDYRSCVLTCDSENCNGSISKISLINNQKIIFIVIMLTLSSLIINRKRFYHLNS